MEFNPTNCLLKCCKDCRRQKRLITGKHHPPGLEEEKRKRCYLGPMTTVPLRLLILEPLLFCSKLGAQAHTEAAENQEPKVPTVVTTTAKVRAP